MMVLGLLGMLDDSMRAGHMGGVHLAIGWRLDACKIRHAEVSDRTMDTSVAESKK